MFLCASAVLKLNNPQNRKKKIAFLYYFSSENILTPKCNELVGQVGDLNKVTWQMSLNFTCDLILLPHIKFKNFTMFS